MRKKIKRILLVYPSFVYKKEQSRKTAIFPLGLGCLASVLEDQYEVRILDSALEGYGNEIEQANGLYCYGLSDAGYRAALREYAPDMVGISAPFSSLHNQVLRVGHLVKEVDPRILTVVGGPHASAVPQILLRDQSIDYCVIGEGEKPLRGLLDCLNDGESPGHLKGIGFKEQGEVRLDCRLDLVGDMDRLPFPAWHLADMERYIKIGSVQGLRMDGARRGPLRLIQVTTSRGCPNRCTYCGKQSTWGDRIRFMSSKRVLEMLDMLVEKYAIERIAFQDDNLTANKRRAMEIFKGLIERKWPVTWEAHNGLAYSTLSEEMFEAMAESGCVGFTGAIESGSEEVLRKIKKPLDLKRATELTQYGKFLGLDVRAFYIIGFPGETRKQIEETREHMRQLQASVSAMALCTPLPGSPLYAELEEQGIMNSETAAFETLSFGAFDMQLSEVPVEELHRIRKIDWLLNVFADPGGNLKRDLPIEQKVVFSEIENGLKRYPDAIELKKLHDQAQKRYWAVPGFVDAGVPAIAGVL